MSADKQAPQRSATIPQDPSPTSAPTPPKPAAPKPPTAKKVAAEYGDAMIRSVTQNPPAKKPKQFEIINLQASPVHVMYTPKGQTKAITLVVPSAGLRPGKYPPEVLTAEHFLDLTTSTSPILKIRPV